MSLVNRMLKDIEGRQPRIDAGPKSERVRQLAMTASAAKPGRSQKLWIGLTLLTLLGAVGCVVFVW